MITDHKKEHLMKQPRKWRDLERHPLSKEYGDIEGSAWERFVAHTRKHGVVRRKVILVPGPDGKSLVVDGWQLQKACVELGKKPIYGGIPEGMSVEEYVEMVNDNRRHEPPEVTEKRIAKRREREAKLRDKGMSLRDIAEQEGVDEGTVRRDLKNKEDSPKKNKEDSPNSAHENGDSGSKKDQKTKENGESGAARAAPEENHEETPKEEQEKTTTGRDGKTYTPKKKTTGKVLFDDRKFRDYVGRAAPMCDARARVYGKSVCQDATLTAINDVLIRIDQWEAKDEAAATEWLRLHAKAFGPTSGKK
jgi:hypothetical protein